MIPGDLVDDDEGNIYHFLRYSKYGYPVIAGRRIDSRVREYRYHDLCVVERRGFRVGDPVRIPTVSKMNQYWVEAFLTDGSILCVDDKNNEYRAGVFNLEHRRVATHPTEWPRTFEEDEDGGDDARGDDLHEEAGVGEVPREEPRQAGPVGGGVERPDDDVPRVYSDQEDATGGSP